MNYKRGLLLFACCWGLGCAGGGGRQDLDVDAQLTSARQTVQSLGMALQEELLVVLEQGGPTAAMAICRERAPRIAAEISEDGGWEVSRTSLRARNSRNRPDAWESEAPSPCAGPCRSGGP